MATTFYLFLFITFLMVISTVFGDDIYYTTPRTTTMWTPYYLSSTTSFDFNKNERQAVQQIQESIKNPYDWQGNKNENYSPRPPPQQQQQQQQQQYKYPSQYFAAQEQQRLNNYNSRLTQNREQQSPYAPPQNYNQQNPNYKYEQWPQGSQNHNISTSINKEQQQQNQFSGPKPYERNPPYNNNQQAQHSRQPWEKPPSGGSFAPYSNEG